jgi:RNA polymerase sigma-70 factor (ECF subfamily)
MTAPAVRPRPASDGIAASAVSPVSGASAAGEASDGDLAARSCVDAEAFGLLYDRYATQIYRMVYQRLRDRSDAEDVTAEVFVKALTAIHTYRPARAPFWGWLHRIAANAVVDHVRARRSSLPLEAVPDDRAHLTGVEDQALHRVEAARAWRAVAQLTPAQRTAVTLRLGGDLPIADIAGRMDRTEGAVKLLLNRGMAAIRVRLADAAPQAVLQA